MTHTQQDYENAAGETPDVCADALAQRMIAFDAGLCSRRAALLGGAEYERDLAETMLELKEAGCAIPRPVALSPRKRTASEERRAA